MAQHRVQPFQPGVVAHHIDQPVGFRSAPQHFQPGQLLQPHHVAAAPGLVQFLQAHGHLLGVGQVLLQRLHLLLHRCPRQCRQLRLQGLQPTHRLVGRGRLRHQEPVDAQVRLVAHRVRQPEHQREVDEPGLVSRDLVDRTTLAGQQPGQLLAGDRRQHPGQAATVREHRGGHEAGLGVRSVDLVRSQLEDQPVGVVEGPGHVDRQRIVTGLEQVERAQQPQRGVGVRHLPQQRHRRAMAIGPGLGQARGEIRRKDRRAAGAIALGGRRRLRQRGQAHAQHQQARKQCRMPAGNARPPPLPGHVSPPSAGRPSRLR